MDNKQLQTFILGFLTATIIILIIYYFMYIYPMFKYKGIFRIYNNELFCKIEKYDDFYKLCVFKLNGEKKYFPYNFILINGVLISESKTNYIIISLNEISSQSLVIKTHDKNNDKVLSTIFLYKVFDDYIKYISKL